MPTVMVQNNFLSILQERLEVNVSDLRSYTNPIPIKRLLQVKIKKKRKKLKNLEVKKKSWPNVYL